VDYYQGVVVEYLRADRSIFVNTECLIQLGDGLNPDKATHWYCDALAVDFRSKTVWLCETSYSKTLAALTKRLAAWNAHWPQIRNSLLKNCMVPDNFTVRPWLFIQDAAVPTAVKKLAAIGAGAAETRVLPDPRITLLEHVTPWTHCTWNRVGENLKPESIPVSMRD
jgi:hypothetical protein